MPDDDDPKASTGLAFAVLNEIGIINQLASTLLERQMPAGMVTRHFAVLNHLVRLGDGRTPLSIAQAFQVPKTSMTHTLSGLEGRGFVVTRPNPEDGRSKLVYLTDAGRTLRDQVIAKLAPDTALILDLFGTDAIARLAPELTRLRQILDQNRRD